MNSKTLIITSEFPPLPGGIGNHAFFLADYLNKNGFVISVLTDFRSKEADEAFDKKQSFSISRTKRNRFTQWNRFIKAFLLVKENETIILSGKFSLWIGGILSLILKKNYIAVLHGSEIRAGGDISKFLTQWSLKQFQTIVAVSNFTKEMALTYNKNLKINVINNGFVSYDTEIEQNEVEIKGNPKIVTVGNVTLRKGQQNVINALPLMKKYFPEIHYHCIGIPTEEIVFMELANKLNVQNNITFHGALPTNEVAEILEQSDVFFMLSDVLKNGDFEGFGIALLEANSLGLPTIGSKNSGIKDAINDGFSGELVNPHDSEEVFLALKKIMSDYQIYSRDAVLWSKNFTWDKVISKYIKIIKN